MATGPLVSVVIPTFNSSKTIERTIESVERQTWKNLEILVIDNHSNDGTVELASRFPGVRTFVFGPERSGQVNFGASQSRGDFIYRIDSDFLLEPRVIQDAVEACVRGADAVLIHNTSDPSVSFWAQVRKVERDTLVDDWEHVAARFVKREVFFAVGGFDERLYAEEDRDFHERLVAAGYKVARIESTEVHLGEPLSLAEVVRKHVYYGESIRYYIQLKGTRAGFRLGPFRRAFLRHWREIAGNPKLLVGFFVYQYVRYASSLAGLLVDQPPLRMTRIRPVDSVGKSDVSVVVVTRDRPEDLTKCLESLKRTTGGRVEEVVIVDDASKEPPQIGNSDLKTNIIRNNRRSFLSESRNKGAKESSGKYIMFIDDDNIVDPDSIKGLADILDANPMCMVASPVICYTAQPERVWFAGGWLAPVSAIFVAAYRGRDSRTLPAHPYQTGVFHDAFMIRRAAFEQVGYFDEVNFPMYLSEADLAARLKKKGFTSFVVPASKVWHSIAPLEGTGSLLRGIHITEPVRAYFVGRNRIFYMRRHSNSAAFLVHVIIFEPVIISIHLLAMLSGHSKIAWTRLFGPYLRGVFDGLAGTVRMGRALLKDVASGR